MDKALEDKSGGIFAKSKSAAIDQQNALGRFSCTHIKGHSQLVEIHYIQLEDWPPQVFVSD